MINYDQMTVEHIGAKSSSALSAESVDMLGNLVLMSEKSNNKVGAKGFAYKKKLFVTLKLPMDDVLGNASKWTDAEVHERTKGLAKILHKALRV